MWTFDNKFLLHRCGNETTNGKIIYSYVLHHQQTIKTIHGTSTDMCLVVLIKKTCKLLEIMSIDF